MPYDTSRQYIEEKAQIQQAAQSMTARFGDLPDQLTGVSLKRWFAEKLHVLNLDASIERSGRRMENVDPDEAMLFLIAGIGEVETNGNITWHEIREFVDATPFTCPLPPREFYPRDNLIGDADGDGWLEYRTPNNDHKTFCLANGEVSEYSRYAGSASP
ncbi:MAG: hypothetical protein KDA47_18390 [Planctomycetales bacterium]|nr:hypothetical protein [Planctomycetales bacterium]